MITWVTTRLRSVSLISRIGLLSRTVCVIPNVPAIPAGAEDPVGASLYGQ